MPGTTPPAASPRPTPQVRAVIFDFYGTIARLADGALSARQPIFERHGYRLDPQIEARYEARHDGVEHSEHSTDKVVYDAWVCFRHGELARECGVAEPHVEALVDALRALDTAPVVAYRDARPTLVELRRRGFLIAVCSNWGWELDRSLSEAGLLDLVDAAVTSARAGARKPHPRIFTTTTDAIGVGPEEVLFVGDSVRPDIEGPIGIGMHAVHIWRRGASSEPPPLPTGVVRVTSLGELLDLPQLRGDANAQVGSREALGPALTHRDGTRGHGPKPRPGGPMTQIEDIAVDTETDDEELDDEVLVEEISIDGMCGVY
ncbi:MAG: mycofactocin precursor MftA [Acidimicrobiales bacterium]